PTSIATSASRSASVPEATATACRRPQKAANSASKASVSGPSRKTPRRNTHAIASDSSGSSAAVRRARSSIGTRDTADANRLEVAAQVLAVERDRALDPVGERRLGAPAEPPLGL